MEATKTLQRLDLFTSGRKTRVSPVDGKVEVQPLVPIATRCTSSFPHRVKVAIQVIPTPRVGAGVDARRLPLPRPASSSRSLASPPQPPDSQAPRVCLKSAHPVVPRRTRQPSPVVTARFDPPSTLANARRTSSEAHEMAPDGRLSPAGASGSEYDSPGTSVRP